MPNNEAFIESVLAQSAHLLRRVAVIRDYGFTFDSETSILLDQTLKLINEVSEDKTKEIELPLGPSCDGFKVLRKQ